MMTAEQRLFIALTIVAVWTLWTLHTAWRAYRLRTSMEVSSTSSLLIGYASQSGQAERAAKARAAALQVSARPLSQLRWQELRECQRLELFVSTYGEGEAPDNGQAFYRMLQRAKDGALSHLTVQLTGFGDSRYPRFCGFADDLQRVLQRLAAQGVAAIDKIDAAAPSAPTTTVATLSCQLLGRQRLNSGRSPGLYQLRLRPAQPLTWRAGDLVEITPPRSATAPETWPRSYSIASVPGEGVLMLIVRLQQRADGSFGHCSQWLTQQLQEGQSLELQVRANPSCQLANSTAPLLLIGAGSGLAGLRSQIAARVGQPNAGPVWLMFGERHPDDDQPLAEELDDWLAQGVLTRIDKVFSRATHNAAYVQSILDHHHASLREFLGTTGHVYLCGNRERMGQAVEASLAAALGQHTFTQLEQQGRLHRDIY